jgi:chromosome partitioning protein
MGGGAIIFVYIILFIGVFYFLAVRPQRRQRRSHQEMLTMLKKGDEVVTIGGMFGTIKEMREDYVVLEVANRVRVKYLKRAISQIVSEEEEEYEEYEEEEEEPEELEAGGETGDEVDEDETGDEVDDEADAAEEPAPPEAPARSAHAGIRSRRKKITRNTRDPRSLRLMAHVLTFANQKGGVAKTTSTLNLGVALKERGLRVLGVDMDPQGNLTMSQGVDPETLDRSMYDVLVHHVPIEDVIVEREIDIATSTIDLAGAEMALSTMIGRERTLDRALAHVRRRYDYILIDTPPSLGLLTINALTASEGVIVPVQCEYLSLRGLLQLEHTLRMIRENLNPKVRIKGILPTLLDVRTLHGREAVEVLRENYGPLVFATTVRKTIKFAEAPVKGSSVLKYDPHGPAAEAYRALAGEVLNGKSR